VQIKLELTPGRWVSLQGNGAVADAVALELEGAAAPPLGGEPVFTFTITDAPVPHDDGAKLAHVRSVQGGVAWRFERMDYDLFLTTSAPLQVTMHIGRRGPPFHIPALLFPLVERTAISWTEAQAYHVMLLIEFVALLSGNIGVLHASAVEREGRALVLTSVGGVGKTTNACRLVNRKGFRHLADDILLVNSDGHCRRSLRKLMVYPYNARDIPELEAKIRRGSKSARLLWDIDRFLGLERRRRRIHANDLFAGRVANNAAFHAAVLLRTGTDPGVRFQEVSAESLAIRANEIVISEFGPFMDQVRLTTALLGQSFRWSSTWVTSRNVELLTHAFERASLLRIADLGANCDPTNELCELMA
jgi:hypothetical protein